MNRCKAFLKPMVFIVIAAAGRCYGQKTGKVIGRAGAYTVFSDSVIQGNYSARALSVMEMVSDYPAVNKPGNAILPHWKLSKDLSAFPRYNSGYLLTDALYNLSLEEMEKAIEPDSTFRTGARWAGVWTRDISYSILLSMAVLQPEVAKKSLMRKVKDHRIIQDTGTGGSYPVSTDRMVWAIAAWEVYKVTGDMNWLQQIYPIIKHSADDDGLNIYDEHTGLVRGESSFLDWREQTYPHWMQPADIFMSQSLGTNAVHYQANRILQKIALQLSHKKEAKEYGLRSARIKEGINKYLWMEDKGYYAQYLYGRDHLIPSRRSESLGEALCVLFDIASQRQRKAIVQNTPSMAFGIPCVYPQIPGMFNYHNNAVWPFVESYWVWAAAKAANQEAVLRGLCALYRAAAFFLTNKENFVASTGDYAGTKVNSSTMLWSLSGNIGMVYKVLFGMELNENNLTFHPFVPASLGGKRTLMNFRYRNATLDITLSGSGNQVCSFAVDGRSLSKAVIPATISGKHEIKIRLSGKEIKSIAPRVYGSKEAPETPALRYASGKLSWGPVKGAAVYRILNSGKEYSTTRDTSAAAPGNGNYQVMAIDQDNYESFASEPVEVNAPGDEHIYEMENFAGASTLPYQGFSGNGFIEIDKQHNRNIRIPVEIKTPGVYSISFRYANGNGRFYDNNKCAMRTLKNGDDVLGTIVFPQRGLDKWSDWGYSNPVLVKLDKGECSLSLVFEPQNENMNGEINQAMLDHLRIVAVDPLPVDTVLIARNFPLLYRLEQSGRIRSFLAGDKVFAGVKQAWIQRVRQALQQCNAVGCYADALQYTPDEIKTSGSELIVLCRRHKVFKEMIRQLRKEGSYALDGRAADTAFILDAWNNEAKGIDRIMDVYIRGSSTRYANIDSISFAPGDEGFKGLIAGAIQRLIARADGSLFFELPLYSAIDALKINGRDEAARYEPLNAGLNRLPAMTLAGVNWQAYKYSVILVPGLGPEIPGVALDPGGMKRCDAAVLRFRQGLAPFIVVSGGHVHPFKTMYNEAVEMKKYMVDGLHIPASAVFIEPYARHTTTNLRNTSRMIFRFGLPRDKPVLVVTDENQSNYIVGQMGKTAIRDLGYAPYKNMKRITGCDTEFYPVWESLQVNPADPLDP